MAESGDGELADRAGVGRQGGGGVVVDLDPAGLAACPAEGDGSPGAGGQGGQLSGDAGVAGPQRDEPDLPVIELGEDGLGGELGIEDQQRRVAPCHLVPVVGERDDFPVLAGFGQVGVGVQKGAGGGVFGEEGQHPAGALGPAGHVVLFQDRILSPVHHGVEVQVQRLALGEPGRDRALSRAVRNAACLLCSSR